MLLMQRTQVQSLVRELGSYKRLSVAKKKKKKHKKQKKTEAHSSLFKAHQSIFLETSPSFSRCQPHSVCPLTSMAPRGVPLTFHRDFQWSEQILPFVISLRDPSAASLHWHYPRKKIQGGFSLKKKISGHFLSGYFHVLTTPFSK